MTALILHSTLPEPPWLSPTMWRLPGIMPLPLEDWLIRDEVFADQMALRDELVATTSDAVHALQPRALPAAQECYDTVLAALREDDGYSFGDTAVTRPDGVTVPLDRSAPLLTLGRLIQSDLCLMQPGEDGHVLTGAILCFPAYWTLAEKIGRPLTAIHVPVPDYDDAIARRVQRLFDAIQPGRPLWRMNANLHASGALFTPKREADPEHRVSLEKAVFVRSERQVLRKLPRTGVTVFSIHTYMIRIRDLAPEARATLSRLVPGSKGDERQPGVRRQ